MNTPPTQAVSGGAEMPWTLADLRAANIARQEEWCPDQMPDLSFRGNELAGETGEACNIIKKLERERQGWAGSRATPDQLADELADVVICADLAALAGGVDLYSAVARKFNATSEKVGLATRLNSHSTLTEENTRLSERVKVLRAALSRIVGSAESGITKRALREFAYDALEADARSTLHYQEERK